jgi:NAD+ synthase
MDMIWRGYEKGFPTAEIAEALEISTDQVERVLADILRKERTTAYLRMQPLTT